MRNLRSVITMCLVFLAVCGMAQSRIVTTKGKTKRVWKIKSINNYEITYKKFLFQVYPFKMKSEKVLYVIDRDGKKTVINDITMAKHYTNYTEQAKTAPKPIMDTLSKSAVKGSFKPHYIERVGDKFRVDTTNIVGPGKINDLLVQSPNPMVQLNLKAARTMRTFTNLSKVASFPGSAGGAFATFKTVQSLSEELKAGPASFGSYFKAGLSFVGTLSLPITSAILKHYQRKAYDKALLMYSINE